MPVKATPFGYRQRPGMVDPTARYLWGALGVFAAAVVAFAVWATATHPQPGAPVLPYSGAVDGIPCDPSPATAYTAAVHLDVFILGKPLTVPANTGVVPSVSGSQCYYWLHTSAGGVINIAAPSKQQFTLGQFFDIWGLPLSATDLAGHQAAGGKSVRAYVGGKPHSGDPRSIPLVDGQEVVLQYGPPWKTPVPATYTFPKPSASGTQSSTASSSTASSASSASSSG